MYHVRATFGGCIAPHTTELNLALLGPRGPIIPVIMDVRCLPSVFFFQKITVSHPIFVARAVQEANDMAEDTINVAVEASC